MVAGDADEIDEKKESNILLGGSFRFAEVWVEGVRRKQIAPVPVPYVHRENELQVSKHYWEVLL